MSEPRPTSIPANAAYTILEALADVLAATHRQTEDFPLHQLGVVFQNALDSSRSKASLTPEEDEAFRHLRDHFHEAWQALENPR